MSYVVKHIKTNETLSKNLEYMNSYLTLPQTKGVQNILYTT